MNFTETATYIRWLAQADTRIQVSDPNIEIWQNALSGIPVQVVREVTKEHYRVNENVQATPAIIRKTGYAAMARETAKQSAQRALPEKTKHPMSFRERNPELWDELFEQGRAEREHDLRTRGLI